MGIFSSKYKTVANSVTTKVLADFDDPLPGIVAGAAVTGKSLTVAIQDYFLDGMFNRAMKYFKYGRDHFVRGLPEQFIRDANINTDEIRRIIETSTSKTVTLLYALVNENYMEHYVRQYLQDTRHMNPETSEIDVNPLDTPVDVVGKLKFISHAMDDVDVSTVLTYEYKNSVDVTLTHTELLTFPYPNTVVYQVQYQEVTPELVPIGFPIYWMYVMGSGTYIVLDSEPQPVAIGQPNYFPIVPFYEDKEEIGNASNSSSELYITCKRLVTRLGFNYKDLAANLAEGTEESIGKDKGLFAYMYLGAEITAGIPKTTGASDEEKLKILTGAQATLDYLVRFFLNEEKNNRHTKDDFIKGFLDSKDKTTAKINSIVITDETFRMSFNYFYITTEYKTGSIGDIGWCTNTFQEDEVEIVISMHPPLSKHVDASLITYRRQESENMYVEIQICGLEQEFHIFDKTVATCNPSAAFKGEESSLITLPLNLAIVQQVPNKLRNRLMHAAICFNFNSYQRIEIKWYQTSLWQFIFTVAAIIIAIPSGGFSLKTLTTIAGITAAAYALVLTYINFIIFKELTKLVVKAFGVEFAYLLAAFFVVYGQFKGMKGAPYAQSILKIGSTIWSATSSVVQDQMADLERDYAKLKSESAKLEEELQKAEDLLKVDNALEPWLFVNPLPDLMFSQKADEFINLRIHTPNPGVLTLQSASVYVELMLRLPTIDDTLTNRVE